MELSFLIVSLLAQAIKSLWFKKDTRKRDVVLPTLVLIGNGLIQLADALSAQGGVAMGALASQTAIATGLSLGTRQGIKWLGALGGR